MREDLARLDKYVAEQEERIRSTRNVTWADINQLKGRKAKQAEKKDLVDFLQGSIENDESEGTYTLIGCESEEMRAIE